MNRPSTLPPGAQGGTATEAGSIDGQVRSRSFAILFCVSVITAVGNTGMQSVLPAIGRTIGIPDPMVAAIFSLSALLWAISSPIWARASDRHGRKPLILLGLAGFALSMVLCSVVVGAGLRHLATPMVIFVFFLLARAQFGLFGSAANPATQAYVAERTTREERTQWMSTLAGAFGLGTIIGPLIATLFVLPIVGLAGPMLAFALMAVAMLAAVVRWLPEERRAPPPKGKEPAHLALDPVPPMKPQALWRDPRLVPFLAYGFLVAVCQTAMGQTLGFLIIDKTHESPSAALNYIRMAMMMGAIAGLLAQWGLIRMFRMSPRHLLRWGVCLAAAGNLITAFAPDYWTVVLAYTLCSLGFSFARPGFTAGASLSVPQEDQARAAGAIAAVNGVNVVLAPLFVKLYEMVPPAPFLLCAAVLVGLAVFAYSNGALRRAGEAATSEDEATISILEKSEEAGSA
ncbi:MFS transporter [Phenylobacterium montanum]|uniref:MFS transporter n=1 Tax=Phenylobacterium montanum TaxID=2823693 RepID=A0A975FYQ9_9CAUL|nr:MFS transporter [Caulobacter sp. S6]QUD86771.1 MFS transporter [Caulobacter sp. S6]